MRVNKTVVLRVTSDLHAQLEKEAALEKISIAEKARRYLAKGMEKKDSNS